MTEPINHTPPQLPPNLPPPLKKMEPTPVPPQKEGTPTYGKKVFMMGLICAALMIGVLAVYILSYSRESNNMMVLSRVADEWGSSVSICGPFVDDSTNRHAIVPGEILNYVIKVKAKTLQRGIYEAEVYDADVKIYGTLLRDSLLQAGDSCRISLDVQDDQISSLNPLIINGRKIKWEEGYRQLFVLIDNKDLPEKIDFSTEFSVKGSKGISVTPYGNKCSVSISGEAGAPSFYGDYIPSSKSVEGRDFSVRWEISSIYIPARSNIYTRSSQSIGTDFLVGIDKYRKVSRSMKYSFLIIVLTFAGVLFVEIIRKHPIPLLNYFLIGAALIVFYTLLLSFVELVSFGYAYLIASSMTILLISGYIWRMLKSKKLGISIGVLLSTIYASCYIMLCLRTYALLMGSLLLFVAVAAMMYGSLRLSREH